MLGLQLRTILAVIMQASLFWAFWMILAGKVGWAEALAGGVAAALATTASHVVTSNRLAPLSVRSRWILELPRLPWLMLKGTWRIFVVLARQLTALENGSRALSLFGKVPFEIAGSAEEAAAQRAAVILYTNMSPDVIIVDIAADGHEAGEMLYHRLDKGPVPEMTCRLGAQP